MAELPANAVITDVHLRNLLLLLPDLADSNVIDAAWR